MFFCLVVMETARATVCTQGITSGLQTHDGSITFDFLSRLEGNPGSQLPASSVNGSGVRRACEGQRCRAIEPVLPLTAASYPVGTAVAAGTMIGTTVGWPVD